jgi:hypothetical protein
LRAPEHSQAYTVGLQKALGNRNRSLWILTAELTELWLSRDYFIEHLGRGTSFYVHGRSIAGHTNRGQILGAGIGTGANSQYLGLRNYRPWGFAGGFIQRHGRNVDPLYQNATARVSSDPAADKIDAEISVGIEGGLWLGNILVTAGGAYGYNINRNYVEDNDVWNLHFNVGAEYAP